MLFFSKQQLLILLVGLILPAALLGHEVPDGVSELCATESEALEDNDDVRKAEDAVVQVLNKIAGTLSFTNTEHFKTNCTAAGGEYVEKDLTVECAGASITVSGAPACLGGNCTDADVALLAEAAIDLGEDACSTSTAVLSFTCSLIATGSTFLLAAWGLF